MKYLLITLVLLSPLSYAGGFTQFATPTKIDIERGGGFMVYGAFGNPGGCTVPDRLYVKKDHSQYDKIYATVLAAFMSGKRVQAYAHSCAPVGWYSVESTTYNTLDPWGVLNITN